ncbi:MAG: PASTA domain-containing protein [Bacteroidaceae bacterium]|nr:PASTA domain-containing protein [Bacteroidaceae bacterium]
MGLKKYFKGKSGVLFWFNALLALAVLIGVPLAAFYSLNSLTHHGEKITVPNVVNVDAYQATEMLKKEGLLCIIGDSTYSPGHKPGAILEQTPAAGSVVKSGRIVYLTINLNGKPLVRMPDLVNNSSWREAEAKLKALDFKLSPVQEIQGYPKGLVVGIKQGTREVHKGDLISTERALTLLVGAGFPEDTLGYVDDTIMVETAADFDTDDSVTE